MKSIDQTIFGSSDTAKAPVPLDPREPDEEVGNFFVPIIDLVVANETRLTDVKGSTGFSSAKPEQ